MTTHSRTCVPATVTITILLGGFAIRAIALTDAPLDFHAARQYHSALLARGYYAPFARELSDAQRTTALTLAAQRHELEPPLLEQTAAWLYRTVGHEALWLPRGLSVLIWILGGAWLAGLAGRWMNAPAVVACLAIYSFLPYGIIASRAFQPDPLMVVLIIATVAQSVAATDSATGRRHAVFAHVAGAAAVFVKPMALPFVMATYTMIALAGGSSWLRGLRRAAVSTLLAMTPAAIYYLATMGSEGRIGGELAARVHPELLVTAQFWRGWWVMVDRVTSGWPLIAAFALLGAIAAPLARPMICALWIAYLVYGLTLTYHIHTHDYYSLVLVPMVALTVGYAIEICQQRATSMVKAKMQWASLALLLASLIAGVLQTGRPLPRKLSDRIQRFEEMGRQFAATTRVTALDGDYGLPVAFHSRLAVATWPMGIDFDAMRLNGIPVPSFESLAAGVTSDYFVVTYPEELLIQPALAARLVDLPRVPSLAGIGEDVVSIYDLRHPTIAVWPNTLRFAKLATSQMAPPAQTLSLRVGGFRQKPWTLTAPADAPVIAAPSEGDQSTEIRVSLSPAAGPAGQSVLTLMVEGVRIRDLPVHWYTVTAAAATAPHGALEAPPANEVVVLPATLGGWALDDIGVTRVLFIGRDDRGQDIELGETAAFGMRPDLADGYRDWPRGGRGAWAALVAAPPGVAISSVTALAEDVDGHRTVLGTRRVAR